MTKNVSDYVVGAMLPDKYDDWLKEPQTMGHDCYYQIKRTSIRKFHRFFFEENLA